jgi:hypothetical protein
MKKSGLLKWGILLCSTTLAVWFVAYRAGYFSPKADDVPAAIAGVQTEVLASDSPESKIHPDEAPQKAVSMDSLFSSKDWMVLASSKSGKIFYPDSPVKAAPSPNAPNETFMGSSKNDGIFEPTRPVLSDDNTEDDFMGTSKSGEVFRSVPRTNIVINPNNASQAPHATDMHKEPEGFINGRTSSPVKPKPQDPNAVNKAPAIEPDPFMGSSKSAPIFHAPAKADTGKLPRNR